MVLQKDQKNWQTLARLTKKKEKIQNHTKITNESGNITTEIKSIIRRYYEQSYSNKVDNLDEMDIFQETQILPRLNHTKII